MDPPLSSMSRTASPSSFFSSAANFFSGDFLNSLAANSFFTSASSAMPSSSSQAMGQMLARNSTKTLKCPKCNWHYKYQETLEIHMKEKHADQEVVCMYCVENQAHPKLARGETYSCGYKPYRCELCKYSTTTKGNLSIHMQSDKHLHALQEIPQSLAAAAAGSSQLLLGPFGQSTGSSQLDNANLGGFTFTGKGALQCLICLSFSTDRHEEMAAHLDQDRGQIQEGDTAALHGFFQCLLCPYSTNLKANFQLHTRTDKHLQRVQLINHLREGSALLGPAEQFARLSSLKSAIQVRCQPCQELFSCGPSLREHCQLRAHLQRMAASPGFASALADSAQSETADELGHFLRDAHFQCGRCSWKDEGLEAAKEHASTHTGDTAETATVEAEQQADQDKLESEERAESWRELDEHLLATGQARNMETMAVDIAEHNDQVMIDGTADGIGTKSEAATKCPLCSAEPIPDLAQHIAQEHNIPAEIAQRLAQQIAERSTEVAFGNAAKEEPTSSGVTMSTRSQSPPTESTVVDATAVTASSCPEAAIFRYRCSHCSLAFRTVDQLTAHALSHSPARMRLLHLCKQSNCEEGPFPSRAALKRHRMERHTVGECANRNDGNAGHFCDICQDGRAFESDQALLAHFNSESHLQRVGGGTSFAEQQTNAEASTSSADPSPPTKLSANHNRRANSTSAGTSTAKHLPYVCNICSQAFGQPGTLDTHLRSMAHAQRMAKLPELVQSGELDPKKLIFEQPEPHPPQRSIGDVARERRKQMGKLGTATQQPASAQQQPTNSLDFLKLGVDQQQQHQQQQMIQLMAQMFGAGQAAADVQQQQFNAAAQMAQMAQMMLSAQVAAQMAASANGFGFLDMFNKSGNEAAQEENKPEVDEPPKAKRPRPGSSTPSGQQRQPAISNGTTGIVESGRASREESAAPQQPGFDLASMLQAFASGSTQTALPQSPGFPFIPSNADPNLQLMAAMAVAQQQFPSVSTAAQPLSAPPGQQQAASNAPSPSPQKRARTRIGDEQIKILRQYFDINNSPSEEQIKEMAQRTQLGEKVIKHWFRNTLFKERQRDKDSPYNFSVPPQMSIDLATYHRTGEARIVPLVKQEDKEEDGRKEEEENGLANGHQKEEEAGSEQSAKENVDEESSNQNGTQEAGENNEASPEPTGNENGQVNAKEEPREEEAQEDEGEQQSDEQQQQMAAESMAAVAADLLASIGRQQLQQQQQQSQQNGAAALQAANPFGMFNPAEQFAQMFSSLPFASASPFGNPFNAFPGQSMQFNPFTAIPSQTAPPTSAQTQQQQNPTNGQQNPPPVSSNSSAQSQPQSGQQTTSSSMGSGRRANRTRFTDFQLRTLQEFFDKQAYPKDDDLEMLSKKMGLSPRVIVVWFQNARQKARKVFEQQPHLLAQHAMVEQGDPRFARTPSTNFQCRACGQVFQRYLELIQHQQRVCFAAEHEKAQQQQQMETLSALMNGKLEEHEEERTPLESTQEMLLRQLMAPLQQQQHQFEQNHNDTKPDRPFHKRCPYCGLLFHCRDKMGQHMQQRHAEQPSLDLELLPEAEEVPGMDLLQNASVSAEQPMGPLDLSVGGRLNGISNEVKEEQHAFHSEASLSPAAFSSAGENDPLEACSPLAALLPALLQPLSAQRPQTQPSPHLSANGGSKRYRTHLTPMQVFIMKSLFHDYKTPSMQECDALGQKIGLPKRVVQVWFQNARAKERKSASASGSAEPEEIVPCCGSTQHCQLCEQPLSSTQSLQEHIFGMEHIEKIRERGALLRGVGTDLEERKDAGSTTPGPAAQQQLEDNANSALAQLGPLAQLPYYALAAAASQLGQPGLPPLFYDPTLYGTPVQALKIPELVAQQILMDMTQRKEHSKFTQDGLELTELKAKLGQEDCRIADTIDMEVGWGCPQCGNVFQQPELLQNHQKAVCLGAEGVFRLVQTHYQCKCCRQHFGTQDDFCAHCQTEEHKSRRISS